MVWIMASGKTIVCSRLSKPYAFRQATDRIERAVGVRPRVFQGAAHDHIGGHAGGFAVRWVMRRAPVWPDAFDLLAASRFNKRWVTTGAAYPACIGQSVCQMGPVAQVALAVIPLSG